MSYETIDLTFDSGLATIELTTPDRGNPIGAMFCREFGEVACEIAARSDVRAVLLQAHGGFFSVGGDITMFADDLDGAPATVLRGTSDMHMALTRLRRLDAPLIGCAQGTAMGGAVAILSNCDLVYGARSAKFGAAYIHLGFTCDLGATHGLASRMGVSRARRFLMLGEMLDCEEALRLGLVDFVADDDAVRAQALEAARRVSTGPTKAYGELRRLFDRVLSNPFETQLEDEAQALARAAGTADAARASPLSVRSVGPVFMGG